MAVWCAKGGQISAGEAVKEKAKPTTGEGEAGGEK